MNEEKGTTINPTPEKILSILAKLYAEQEGVKIKYIVEIGETK